MDISILSMLMPASSPVVGTAGELEAESAPNAAFSQLIAGAVAPVGAVLVDPSSSSQTKQQMTMAKSQAISVLQMRPVNAAALDQVLKQQSPQMVLEPVSAEIEAEPNLEVEWVDDLQETPDEYALLAFPPVAVYAEEDKPVATDSDSQQALSGVMFADGDEGFDSNDLLANPNEIEPQGLAPREAALPLNLTLEAPVLPAVADPETNDGNSTDIGDALLAVETFPGPQALTDGEEAVVSVIKPETPVMGNRVDVVEVLDTEERSVLPLATQEEPAKPQQSDRDGLVGKTEPSEASSDDNQNDDDAVKDAMLKEAMPIQLGTVLHHAMSAKLHKIETSSDKPIAVQTPSRALEKSRPLKVEGEEVIISDEHVFEVMDEASDELEAMVERIVSQRSAPVVAATSEHVFQEASRDAKGNGAEALSSVSNLMSSSSGRDAVEAQKLDSASQQAHLAHRHVTDQVQVSIRKAVDTGNDRLVMQLDPAHLGKVEVRMEINAAGATHIVFTTENKATLEALQQDARHLERMLQDSGIKADAGAMEFNLRQGQGYQNGSGMENASSNSREEILPPEVATEGEVEKSATTTHYMVQVTDGIDIKV